MSFTSRPPRRVGSAWTARRPWQDEPGHELLFALVGGAQPAGERRGRDAAGVEVRERGDWAGVRRGPACGLEPVEQLPVEPAARFAATGARAADLGHELHASAASSLTSGDLTFRR